MGVVEEFLGVVSWVNWIVLIFDFRVIWFVIDRSWFITFVVVGVSWFLCFVICNRLFMNLEIRVDWLVKWVCYWDFTFIEEIDEIVVNDEEDEVM